MRAHFERGEGIAPAVVVCIGLALFVFPLGLLAQVAFRDGFGPLMQAFDTRSVPRALWNSLDSAAVSAGLVLIAVVVVMFQLWLSTRRRNALIGPPQPPLDIRLGRARPWAETALGLAIVVTLVLPVTALFTTALVPT
ncbi:MAG: hypothetical protein AAGE38_17605 [Pseudomonadota bacterium]